MAIEIRAIRRDEVSAFRAALVRAFGVDAQPGAEDEHFRSVFEVERAYAAFEGGALVGTLGAFSFEVTVPGAVVPMAGLTMVTVQPTHRRRGVLRGMMSAHFEDVRRRGEALSGLWASEASIYGRFGYGPATEIEAVSIDVRGVALDSGHGADAVRLIEGAALHETIPRLYDLARPNRPGALSRSAAWWANRTLGDTPDKRRGASQLRAAVSTRGDAPTGYALYRQRPGWEKNLPAGSLDVLEVVAIDGPAEASLWRLLCTVDLFPHVSWWNAPADSVLPWIVKDRRRVQRRRLDNLWIRPSDIGRALEARRYSADGMLRIAVEDAVDPQNQGTFALVAEGGVARCTRDDRAPDVRTDAAGLGAMYMGAHAPSLLARAGRLAGDPSGIARADAMFAWPAAAWCPEVF